MKTDYFLADSNIKLAKRSTQCHKSADKKEIKKKLMPENLLKLRDFQSKLYAEAKHGLIIVFQAMDTAGKDGVIKHVLTALNPQGMQVVSFKKPSSVELSHDYLWRIHKHAPPRGGITVFNRSHYEDVIVTKVHNLIKENNVPDYMKTDEIWNQRYEQIRNYEKYLYENGIHTIKFFLHLSKDEQKNRLLARIDNKEKNWKFSEADIDERQYWDSYQDTYEKMLQNTSTKNAPWYVIPADQKWYSRYIVSEILLEHFKKINPQIPELCKTEIDNLSKWKEKLLNETK